MGGTEEALGTWAEAGGRRGHGLVGVRPGSEQSDPLSRDGWRAASLSPPCALALPSLAWSGALPSF